MVGLKDTYLCMGLGSVIIVISNIISIFNAFSTESNCCLTSISFIGLLFIIIGIYFLRKKREQLPDELNRGVRIASYGVALLIFITLISVIIAFSLADDIISLYKSKNNVTMQDLVSLIRSYLPTTIALSIASAIAYITGIGGTNFWNKDFSLRLIIFLGIILIIVPAIINIPYQYDALYDVEQRYGDKTIEEMDLDEFQEYSATKTNYPLAILIVLGYLLVGIPNFITANRLPEEKSELEKQIDRDYYTSSTKPVFGEPGPYSWQLSGHGQGPVPGPRRDLGQEQELRHNFPNRHTSRYPIMYKPPVSITSLKSRSSTGPVMPGIKTKACRFCGRQINWRAVYCPWCKKYLI